MHLIDLPAEIVFHILEYCSSSNLASISRVHTSFQGAAESILYHHVCIGHSDLVDATRQTLWAMTKDGSLFDTLMNHVRKASLVKVLYFEIVLCYFINFGILDSILMKLAEALKSIPNLVDLRIKYGMATDLSKGRISQVIKDGYFQLNTLCLEHDHDIEGIIVNQPNLQLFGVFHYHLGNALDIFKNIKSLCQRPAPHGRKIPTFFILNCSLPTIAINMFPSSQRPGEALQLYREVGKWLLASNFYGTDGFLSFSLLGISEENISLLTESMEVAATRVQPSDCPFMRCPWLRIVIHDTTMQKPWQYPKFVESLALFKNVQVLHFYFHDLGQDEELGPLVPLYMDLRSCLVKDLGHAWPGIREVVLHNRQWARVSIARSRNWNPYNTGGL